jgi:1-acyl-sn-glycerol-3-phosphate acyltransferase
MLLFIAFMPFLFFFTVIKKNHIYVAHITRYWSKLTLWLSFIIPLVEWEKEISKEEQYIFCPNHASTLDIPLILAVVPMPIQYIGKAEIARIPIFGYFYRKNSVIVNREKKKDAYAAFLRAGERLNEGLNMCIFPEGGIPAKNVFLKKFKNGPFKLAMEKNISVIPVTIADNKIFFPQEYFKGRPGIVRIKIHKAIDYAKLKEKSIENLNRSVYNTIFEQLKIYEQKD